MMHAQRISHDPPSPSGRIGNVGAPQLKSIYCRLGLDLPAYLFGVSVSLFLLDLAVTQMDVEGHGDRYHRGAGYRRKP